MIQKEEGIANNSMILYCSHKLFAVNPFVNTNNFSELIKIAFISTFQSQEWTQLQNIFVSSVTPLVLGDEISFRVNLE